MKQNETPTETNQLLDKVATGYGGSYTILELIGRGGMSDVYRARIESTQNENPTDPLRATSTGKIVACKVLLARLLDSKQHSKRFHHEATLAKRLMHPNIVNVYDAGEIDGRPFMILEYVSGATLSDTCKEQGKLPIHRALPIFLQISGAFAYAHLNNIIHRDLKPSNIMLTKKNDCNDFVKVVDFGIAKIISETTMGSTQLTKTGDVFGTPVYMSPEQCRGDALDVRSDIYSFGILMYETLTGHPPFEGPDSWSILLKQNSELPKGLGDIDQDILLVKKLERIIFKCLEKEPTSRYQTMNELMRDLELVQLHLNQISSGKTNPALLALQRVWLSISQSLRIIGARLFSIRLSSSGVTIGSVLIIVFIVLVLASIFGATFLFGSAPSKNIADRELLLKPIIDLSIKPPDQNSLESLWRKLQSHGEDSPDILESAMKIFINAGNLNQKFASYHQADLCYSRAEQIARRLNLGNSILFADLLNAHAENQLISNMAAGSISQIRNENVLLKEKQFDLFVKPAILRALGLELSANAASARDYSLEALTIMKQIDKTESIQSLLAYGLLAQSALELNIIEGAMGTFDSFHGLLSRTDLPGQLDKSRAAIVLAWAGRAYLQQHKLNKAEELLSRSNSNLVELGNLGENDLTVIYNDLGLAHELNGDNKEAELLFGQACSSLSMSARSARQQKVLILNNLANAALKAGDYITAIKSKIAAAFDLSIQI